MADTKLTGLTALTVPVQSDILYITDDPGGTPLPRKITLQNLRKLLNSEKLVLGNDGDADFEWNGTDLIVDYDHANSGTSDFRLQEDGTDRLVVLTGGNVGIGANPSNRLSVTGGDVNFAAGFIVGHTAQLALSNGSGSVVIPELQLIGTLTADSTFGLHRNSANGLGPNLLFSKSRHGTIGSFTIVQDGDDLGSIHFAGDDGVDYQSTAGRIRCEVDGTPGVGDMPGRMSFWTTADGADSPTERITIKSSGKVGIGTTAPLQLFTIAAFGTNSEPHLQIVNYNDQIAFGPIIDLTKSHTDTLNTLVDTLDQETLGSIIFQGIGTSQTTVAGAEIIATQIGSAQGSGVPSRLQFSTTQTSSGLLSIAVTIDDSQNVGIGTTSPDSRLDLEGGALSMLEMTSPSAPASNKVVIFAEDNGSGKTRLMARFNSGATQQLAIEP